MAKGQPACHAGTMKTLVVVAFGVCAMSCGGGGGDSPDPNPSDSDTAGADTPTGSAKTTPFSCTFEDSSGPDYVCVDYGPCDDLKVCASTLAAQTAVCAASNSTFSTESCPHGLGGCAFDEGSFIQTTWYLNSQSATALTNCTGPQSTRM